MNCEDYRQWISGYLDEELDAGRREQLQQHLQTCEACRRELEELVQIKENLAMIHFKEPLDADLDRYWSNVYNRLERGVGWICFSLGAILLLCWGAFEMIEEVIQDPAVSMIVKIGMVALIVGTVILFVSLARERLMIQRKDKYSREIER
jgi:predicted anti-sigma-YlaC factor YlaD